VQRIASLVALLAGFLSVGCQPSAPDLTAAHADAIQDSLANVLEQFRQHSAAAEWNAVGAFYSDSPDFRFFESGELRYGSAEAVRSALAGLPPGTSIITDYRDREILALAPGLATVSTLFESTFTDGGGSQFTWGGALTLIWVHELEGWRMLRGHSSAPVPRGG
jgi:ketosteroid isomerase-like protein